MFWQRLDIKKIDEAIASADAELNKLKTIEEKKKKLMELKEVALQALQDIGNDKSGLRTPQGEKHARWFEAFPLVAIHKGRDRALNFQDGYVNDQKSLYMYSREMLEKKPIIESLEKFIAPFLKPKSKEKVYDKEEAWVEVIGGGRVRLSQLRGMGLTTTLKPRFNLL